LLRAEAAPRLLWRAKIAFPSLLETFFPPGLAADIPVDLSRVSSIVARASMEDL
jgi:hypothetical protein